MSEFLEYVLWQLQNSLILVLLAGIAAAAVVAVAYLIHKRKYRGEQKFPWGKTVLWLVFLGYLVIVLYATILRNAGGYRDWNLHLFRAWREAWNNFSTKNWANVLLNIAMFTPLGFLLPLLGRKFRKWHITVPTGFAASLVIELVQLALGRGICDVDDLFCNTLGAAMGYFAVMFLLSLFGKQYKHAGAYLSLTLVPAIAIGSIFAAYHMKEFGNLPDAAAYSVNLDHLNWTVTCELPNSSEQASVYRTQTLNKTDCDALAAEIAALCGTEVDMVSYYQEMAYYNFPTGIAMIYYHDGSFEFRVFNQTFEIGQKPERESIEQALEQYPILIPEAAEFAVEEDGWYSFTCDQYIDGAVMMDGTLRVHHEVTESHTQLEVENHLVWYTHYKDIAIISPAEAFDALKEGRFAYAESLKRYAGDSVTVVSCELDHAIDTKGFYQPVYRFSLTFGPGGDIWDVMIPAIK